MNDNPLRKASNLLIDVLADIKLIYHALDSAADILGSDSMDNDRKVALLKPKIQAALDMFKHYQ